MKWYFASRAMHRSKLISISEFLKTKDQKIVSEWIFKGSLKPYEENLNQVQTLSKEVVSSILGADIFVLVSDPEGTDMFVELGICLAKKTLSGDIKIYIIGEHSKRSLMQLHPSIIHAKNIEEVFKHEKISYKESEISSLQF